MLNKLVDNTRIERFERLIRYFILLGLFVTLAGVTIIMLLNSYQESQIISCKTDTCKKISKFWSFIYFKTVLRIVRSKNLHEYWIVEIFVK